MKKIIVNADDFGYRTQINKAIVYAHKNGVVTSTTMLVDRQAFDEAVILAKENPSLAVGLHVDLDRYFDIQHGAGIIRGWLDGKVPLQSEIKSQIRRQADKLLSAGITPSHFDSHHHTHMVEEIFYSFVDVCKEYKINKIRFFENFCKDKSVALAMKKYALNCKMNFADKFIEGWYYGNIDEDFTVAELMTHPGYNEAWREEELRCCCDVELKKYCTENNISFINFEQL